MPTDALCDELAVAIGAREARWVLEEVDRQAAEQSDLRRSQVGGGGRSEKIRTYNFKENRVTDHRINVTVYKLDRVLAGELDELITLLAAAEREAQLESASSR